MVSQRLTYFGTLRGEFFFRMKLFENVHNTEKKTISVIDLPRRVQ